MTYRIQVTDGGNYPDDTGKWVVSGTGKYGFGYSTHAAATVFSTRADAEAVIAARAASKTISEYVRLKTFKIVADYDDYGAFVKAYGPLIQTSAPLSFRFIGGPKDGEYLALQEEPPMYVFPVAVGLQARYDAGISLYGNTNVGRAVYLRHKLAVNPSNGQPLQEYTVYVYSHVEGLVPTDPGQKVLFDNRTWLIDSISWMPTGARFQARECAARNGRAFITAEINALYYKWDVDAWAFKSKSIVEVDETYTVVVR